MEMTFIPSASSNVEVLISEPEVRDHPSRVGDFHLEFLSRHNIYYKCIGLDFHVIRTIKI